MLALFNTLMNKGNQQIVMVLTNYGYNLRVWKLQSVVVTKNALEISGLMYNFKVWNIGSLLNYHYWWKLNKELEQ